MKWWLWIVGVPAVALVGMLVLGALLPRPAPFVPVDLTAQRVEQCRAEWPRDKGLREGCIAAVKSVSNLSTDPNGPKTIGDTCREQFPSNTSLQLACIDRGMASEVDAKMQRAAREAR
jgi:hypothetical protein